MEKSHVAVRVPRTRERSSAPLRTSAPLRQITLRDGACQPAARSNLDPAKCGFLDSLRSLGMTGRRCSTARSFCHLRGLRVDPFRIRARVHRIFPSSLGIFV